MIKKKDMEQAFILTKNLFSLENGLMMLLKEYQLFLDSIQLMDTIKQDQILMILIKMK